MAESLRPWRILSPFYFYNGNKRPGQRFIPAHALFWPGWRLLLLRPFSPSAPQPGI